MVDEKVLFSVCMCVFAGIDAVNLITGQIHTRSVQWTQANAVQNKENNVPEILMLHNHKSFIKVGLLNCLLIVFV